MALLMAESCHWKVTKKAMMAKMAAATTWRNERQRLAWAASSMSRRPTMAAAPMSATIQPPRLNSAMAVWKPPETSRPAPSRSVSTGHLRPFGADGPGLRRFVYGLAR